MIIVVALSLLLGLLSAFVGVAVLVFGAILPFLSPILSILGTASGFLLGLACAMLVVGLWQPIGAALDIGRVEGSITTAKSRERAWRWYAGGWGKWGVGVDVFGFALDLYTVGRG